MRIRILLCRILRRKRVAFKRQFPLRLRVHPCRAFLYHREVRRTFLWYKKALCRFPSAKGVINAVPPLFTAGHMTSSAASVTSTKVLSCNGDKSWNLTPPHFRRTFQIPGLEATFRIPSFEQPFSAPAWEQPFSLLRGNTYSSSSLPFLLYCLLYAILQILSSSKFTEISQFSLVW